MILRRPSLLLRERATAILKRRNVNRKKTQGIHDLLKDQTYIKRKTGQSDKRNRLLASV